MTRRLRAVFLDFDGVIVDSGRIKQDAFAELFREEGPGVVGKVVEYHLAHGGVSRFEKFRHIYREMLGRPLDPRTLDELCGRFSSLVLEKVIRAPFVKGAREFLERSSGKYECILVSGTPTEELRRILRERGIGGHFREVYGAPTPKGEAVKEVLARRRLDPAETVFVGDSMADHDAARENSVPFVGVAGPDDPVFRGAGCPLLEDLSGLDAILDRPIPLP